VLLPQYTVYPRSSPQSINLSDQGATITATAGTVYYANRSTVTSGSYDGSLASGQSVTLYGTQWLTVDPAGARATFTVSPITVTGIERRRAARLTAQGFLGETAPRDQCSGSFAPTAGNQYATLTGLLAGETITTLTFLATVAGSSTTLFKAAIWSTAGALVASSATIHTTVNTGTGLRPATLTTPFTAPNDGAWYLGLLSVGGTSPTLLKHNAVVTGYTAAAPTGGVPSSIVLTGQTDLVDMTLVQSASATWVAWT
jgi:hypothetical protein